MCFFLSFLAIFKIPTRTIEARCWRRFSSNLGPKKKFALFSCLLLDLTPKKWRRSSVVVFFPFFSGRALRHLGGCCSWSRLGGTKKLPTTSSSTGDWSKLRLPILLSGAFYDAAQSFTTRRAWRTSNEKPRTQIASKKYCMISILHLVIFQSVRTSPRSWPQNDFPMAGGPVRRTCKPWHFPCRLLVEALCRRWPDTS